MQKKCFSYTTLLRPKFSTVTLRIFWTILGTQVEEWLLSDYLNVYDHNSIHQRYLCIQTDGRTDGQRDDFLMAIPQPHYARY